MRRITILIIAGLIGAALIGGCGDDETVTNTVYVTDTLTLTDTLVQTPQVHISGYALVDPGLYMYADMYSYGPLEPTIDSVLVADSQAIVGLWTSISTIEPVAYAIYDNIDDTRLVSGDIAEIKVHSGQALSSASIKLLNYSVDTAVIVSPAEDDTSDAGAGFNIVWESVEYADWYGLSLQYVYDIETTRYVLTFIGSTTDTQFTIDGSLALYNGYYDIGVVPVTGPDPESTEGNVAGDVVAGTIYSLGRLTAHQLTIGDGLSDVLLAPKSVDMKSIDKSKDLIEMLKGTISDPQVRKLH